MPFSRRPGAGVTGQMNSDEFRRIVHIDMDAFYASVEQRDRPELRGLPVVVGGSPYSRGVVAASSYEARQFGIKSAMPCRQALSLCADTIFVPPRFDVYQQVSRQIQSIFQEYTPLVEPLSLDEAYLDLTDCELFDGSATRIARAIKAQILEQTQLVASAGVSYNKFLAKIASDMDKPDGFYRILPQEGEEFIARLPIGRFFGIGAVTESKMHSLGISSGADLRAWTLEDLQAHFGVRAEYYFDIARGVDNRPVSAERVRKSIGTEMTFDRDLENSVAMLAALQPLAAEVSDSMKKRGLLGVTLTLKVRFDNFQLITRSHTMSQSFNDQARMHELLPLLLDRAVAPGKRVRLLGVSMSGLESVDGSHPRQLDLF